MNNLDISDNMYFSIPAVKLVCINIVSLQIKK